MIQKLPGFSLEMIEGKPYLLPYGQNLADRRRGMTLDQTGLFIWNTLDEVASENDLFFRYAAHKSLGVSEFQDGKKEMENFLLDLEQHGFIMIDERRQKPEVREPFYKGIRIAALTMKLYGDKSLFSEKLDRYLDMSVVEHAQSDLSVVLTTEQPPVDEYSRILIRSHDRIIAENEFFFTFLYPTYDAIREVRLAKDGSLARIYYTEVIDEDSQDDLKEQIFQILRTDFIYPASQKRTFALFSTSVFYQNRLWLLAGASKQFRMHFAELWNTCIGGSVINPDLNLIKMDRGRITGPCNPWGGPTNRYLPEPPVVGGIILLKNAEDNHIMHMSPSGKILQVSRHMLSPTWTQSQIHYQYVFTEELLETLPVIKIGCRVNENAVELLKSEIDRILFGASE